MKDKKRIVPEEVSEAAKQEEKIAKIRDEVANAVGTMFLIYYGMPISKQSAVETGKFFTEKYNKTSHQKVFNAAIGEMEGHRDQLLTREMRSPELILMERLEAILEKHTAFKRYDIKPETITDSQLTQNEEVELGEFFQGIVSVNEQELNTVMGMAVYMVRNWRRGNMIEKYEQITKAFIKANAGESYNYRNIEQPWFPLVVKMTDAIKSGVQV
jgi:hypothetical protein